MNYPFTAIVGQEKLKRALLLCAINPAIGGLLIQGDKGTAKSTAARALAAVFPPLTKARHCQFNCVVNNPAAICEICAGLEKEYVEIPVPFVNLPIGATEERVLGSLDLEAVLVEKKKKFQPGLLAAVHQGILYIDEVNLLPDHLVDVLLDVAAMGENRIEREGLSLSHPSRFTLIGTMNPEEGQLRPQFLDRFGLMVQVEASAEVAERTEVVKRRIAFESDPLAFGQKWETAEQEMRQHLVVAKQLLPAVELDDELLGFISGITIAANVRSMRADIVMYKTAIAIAALEHRKAVTADDITEAADLVLAHRSRKSSAPAPQPEQQKEQHKGAEDKLQNTDSGKKEQQEDRGGEESGMEDSGGSGGTDEEQLFGAEIPVALPKIEGVMLQSGEQGTGRRSMSADVKRGLYIRPEPARKLTDIAIEATVVHALLRDPAGLEITAADLQQKKRHGKMGNLILFVVDASGSMAAGKRMEAVKGTVLSLLTEAYEKRDTVGVIAFRGIEAQLLLRPTQRMELAEEAMRTLPTGGRTPLPGALQAALRLLATDEAKKGYHPIVVLLTDGKANVPLSGAGGDPWTQTLQLAAQFKASKIQSLVINTESNYFNLNKAEELAAVMGGEYQSLDDISAAQLTPIINQLSYKSR